MAVPDVVVAPRTDPIYNAHGYLTKVPVDAILPFIEEYTREGQVVLDLFAGSGMTGVAAHIAGRRSLLNDLSVLGRHIGEGYLTRVERETLEKSAERVLKRVRDRRGELYKTVRESDGEEVEWVRTLWSFVYECPECTATLNFFHALSETSSSTPSKCGSCGAKFVKRAWRCVGDEPVATVVQGESKKQVEQPILDHDLALISKAQEDDELENVPSLPIAPDREMYRRSALGKSGLTETRLFFTARNALMLYELWRAIRDENSESTRKKLMFAFTAILPRASRRYQWSRQRPLNAQNQTYYISPVHFEWNVLDLFARKVRAALRAQDYMEERAGRPCEPQFEYSCASADALAHVKDNSVDYVFTDPPFGSNIFYSDMSLFQEAWLDDVTDNACEAVIHTGRGKKEASERYEHIMTNAFREALRVLKPGGHMSVVFGNSRGNVWSRVQRALRLSGFEPVPVHLALLDKGQRSVKGLASGRESVVTVDLVLTVRKPAIASRDAQPDLPLEFDRTELVRAALGTLSAETARNPSYVYVAAVKEAIRRGIAVDSLHLSDVLLDLAAAGYSIDPKSGLLNEPVTRSAL